MAEKLDTKQTSNEIEDDITELELGDSELKDMGEKLNLFKK
jgi:hypothetical protein